MGYKLYQELNGLYPERQGEVHSLLRMDIPELETEQEVADMIVELCMTSNLTIENIRVMQELEVKSWGYMKKGFQK